MIKDDKNKPVISLKGLTASDLLSISNRIEDVFNFHPVLESEGRQIGDLELVFNPECKMYRVVDKKRNQKLYLQNVQRVDSYDLQKDKGADKDE